MSRSQGRNRVPERAFIAVSMCDKRKGWTIPFKRINGRGNGLPKGAGKEKVKLGKKAAVPPRRNKGKRNSKEGRFIAAGGNKRSEGIQNEKHQGPYLDPGVTTRSAVTTDASGSRDDYKKSRGKNHS